MEKHSKTTWHNFEALALESEALRVVIVPDLGAKIVSLYDKMHGREWLVPPIRPVKQTVYGSVFVDQDMSGWDEMMPTITACEWEGVHLPDHGEVWSSPWKLETREGGLTLSVDGPSFPYHFVRSATLIAPDTLELRYSLTNTGQKELPFMWTAHPQFAANVDTRIVFPPEVTQVVNVIEDDPVLGKTGDLCTWPEANSITGQVWKLDRVRSVENHTCRKIYTLPQQPVSSAALVDEHLGCQLRLEWSSEFAPYLGLWIDEGMFNTAPVAALEPSNGYYDSLERAVQNQMIPWLKPGQEVTWAMQVQLCSV
jgi:galactose mutarotase-like enzyme